MEVNQVTTPSYSDFFPGPPPTYYNYALVASTQSCPGLPILTQSTFGSSSSLGSTSTGSALAQAPTVAYHHLVSNAVPTFQPLPPPASYINLDDIAAKAREENAGALHGAQLPLRFRGATKRQRCSPDENGGDRSPQSDSNDGSGKPPPDPFAAEAIVPLPFQLTDDFGYFGPAAVWKRNERERLRVRSVNEGYERLRIHLPLSGRFRDKRISKVETLRLAIRYITHLQLLLSDPDHAENCECVLEPKLSEDGGMGGSSSD